MSSPRRFPIYLLPAFLVLTSPSLICGQSVASVRSARVLPGGNQVEIDIESSNPVIPQVNELGHPDRLLIDFVRAKPGPLLRGLTVNRAEVKDLRVGLFSADPPVTRIVIDLKSPQAYQVFPSGRTTIVKIGTPGADSAALQPAITNLIAAAGDPPSGIPPAPPKASLQVEYRNGLLSINSDRATMADILNTVHQRTGAEIVVPAGMGKDEVVVNLGPGPAPAVLSHLLNGSKFNFLILSSPKNPGELDQVILTARPEGSAPVQAAAAPQPAQPEPSQPDPDERFRMHGRPMLPPFRDIPPTEDQNQNPPPSTDEPQ